MIMSTHNCSKEWGTYPKFVLCVAPEVEDFEGKVWPIVHC